MSKSSTSRRARRADSARARGEALSIGAKALVIKTDDQFRLFVLPADRKARLPGDQTASWVSKKCGLPAAEELLDLTGLMPGSVPPFGPPVLPLELWADPALCDQTENRLQCRLADDLDRDVQSPPITVCAGARWLAFSQATS